MSETPTPRTDAFYDARFQNTAATWEEKFKDACDFARQLERERDEALEKAAHFKEACIKQSNEI